MSLVEKIKLIKENISKVYEAGCEAGKNYVEYILKAGTYTVDPYKLFSYSYSHSINLNFVSNGQPFTSIKVPTEEEYMWGEYRCYYDDVYVYDDFDTWENTSYEYQYITIESDQKVTQDVYEVFANGTDYSKQLWQIDNTFTVTVINNCTTYSGTLYKDFAVWVSNTNEDDYVRYEFVHMGESKTFKVNKYSFMVLTSSDFNNSGIISSASVSSTCGDMKSIRCVYVVKVSRDGEVIINNPSV
jgi:hypothetical protein